MKTVIFPFSPNVPWALDRNIIIPKLSSDIFSRIKDEAKSFNVICPGYLLELIVVAKIKDIFTISDINIDKWIVPDFYTDLLKLFDFNFKGSKGDMFSEYRRIRKVVDSYPAPIFMDEDNNVYFNLLFNYGDRVSYKNRKGEQNKEKFWKQILNNTCLEIDYKIKDYSLDLKDVCDTFFKNNGIDFNKRFLLIDNSNLFGIVASGVKINNAFIFPEQARNIAGYLYNNGIQCIIMTNNKKEYFGKNLFPIDPWNKTNLIDLASLIKNAYGVISSDPNIYLTSAIFGCKKILCSDELTVGWRFSDLRGFCKIYKDWYSIKNPRINDIVEIFGKEKF